MDHNLKAALLLSKYYLRQVSKRTIGLVPFLLFLVSFCLFLVAFLPSIGQRLASNLARPPARITLTGQVFVERSGDQENALTSAEAAQVEIGAFTTTTDASGSYQLEFLTPRRDDIPVVIRFQGATTVERLNLPSTGGEWTRNWVLHEE